MSDEKRGREPRDKVRGRVESDRTVIGYIFRPYRDLPNGRRLWARAYGLKAWRIPQYADEPNPAARPMSTSPG